MGVERTIVKRLPAAIMAASEIVGGETLKAELRKLTVADWKKVAERVVRELAATDSTAKLDAKEGTYSARRRPQRRVRTSA
jgi:hypothetical protein